MAAILNYCVTYVLLWKNQSKSDMYVNFVACMKIWKIISLICAVNIIFFIFLRGYELEKSIVAFDMKCYRKLLNIPWVEHKTNNFAQAEIVRCAGPQDPF